MSLLLQALAQINSRAPAASARMADEELASPDIVADKIEPAAADDLQPAAPHKPEVELKISTGEAPQQPIENISTPPPVILLDSMTSLAAEFSSEIPAQTEEARPSSAVISEAAAFQEWSAIDLTLEQLSDLCQAIDADVAQTAITLPVPIPPVVPAPVQPSPPPLPQVVVVKSPPVVLVPTVKVRDEIRILKESISARLPLAKHATLIFVDGGHAQTDYSWLWAFAASVLNGSSTENATAVCKVLIVDAAGPESGVASALGLDVEIGLSDVLRGTTPLQTAIQETFHPQIRFLPRGTDSILADKAAALAKLWAGLSQDFDLLLVAVGPLGDGSADDSITSPAAAEVFLPLAGGVILCVELDSTPVAACRKSKTILESSGAKLLGCIVHGDSAA
jgi:Mrp family chromosome partitioning ATPase